MHLYIIIRGIRHQVEIFERFIQAQMFPWKVKDLKTNTWKWEMVQLALRDAGPFKELCFPEEALEEVLRMLDYVHESKWVGDYKTWCIRRFIGHGVRKIPKIIKTPLDYPWMSLVGVNAEEKPVFQPYRFIEMRGVDLTFIGIKKDLKGELYGRYQELL